MELLLHLFRKIGEDFGLENNSQQRAKSKVIGNHINNICLFNR